MRTVAEEIEVRLTGQERRFALYSGPTYIVITRDSNASVDGVIGKN